MHRFHRFVSYHATWPLQAALLLGVMICLGLFAWRERALGGAQVFDVRLQGYTYAEAVELLEGLGAPGRRLYVVSQLTVDALYPLVYGTLLIAWMSRVVSKRQAWMLFIPLSGIALDYLENGATIYMTIDYQHLSPTFVAASAWVTRLKFGLALLSVGIILGGGIAAVLRALGRQQSSVR